MCLVFTKYEDRRVHGDSETIRQFLAPRQPAVDESQSRRGALRLVSLHGKVGNDNEVSKMGVINARRCS